MNILSHPLIAYSFCFLPRSASAGFATARGLAELILHVPGPCVAVGAWRERNFIVMIVGGWREGQKSEMDALLCVVGLWVRINQVTWITREFFSSWLYA